MTTLGSITTRALVKARGSSQYLYEEKDAQLLGIANGILHEIYDALRAIESNLVYAIQTKDTVASTAEYALTTAFDDILSIWLKDSDGVEYDPLTEVDEEYKRLFDTANVTAQPQYYYLTEDAKVGLLDIPDAVYTMNVIYHPALTELTALTGSGSTMPWKDLWNKYIEAALVVELLEIQERQSQLRLVEKKIAWDQAMNATLKLGVRRKVASDEMFSTYGEYEVDE